MGKNISGLEIMVCNKMKSGFGCYGMLCIMAHSSQNEALRPRDARKVHQFHSCKSSNTVTIFLLKKAAFQQFLYSVLLITKDIQ